VTPLQDPSQAVDSARAPGGLHPKPAAFLNRATASAAILSVLILTLDVLTPKGSGIGTLYVLPLLAGSLTGPPRPLFVGAAAASALTVLGALVPSGAPLSSLAAANRAIALLIIWSTAYVLGRFRETWLSLQVRSKELADIDYALDQSAIVATTDTRGTITYVNEKFCEISKYRRDELLGQDHRLINSRYHPKEFIRNLWVTIANGRIWRGELRNRAKDGTIYWVDTTIVPFLDARGKPFQYMAIRYEITERKRSEELLREQAALARLGEMAAVVAHEVKNPIAGIRGALQVIASRTAESRDKGVISDIIARLDALNGVVRDLLIFARPRELRTETVDLRSTIAGTADLLTRDPALRGLHVKISGPDAVIRADREQLQILFHNILVNAAQAMGGAGDVDVVLGSSPGGWTISVADHGPGMPPEVKDKAFEAFFTTKHRGTGLGLPTARRIAEAHGGRIELGEATGGGTVVSIKLPAAH